MEDKINFVLFKIMGWKLWTLLVCTNQSEFNELKRLNPQLNESNNKNSQNC